MSLMTFLFPKLGHVSRAGAGDHYPFDYDASLRYTRQKTGYDFFPVLDNAHTFQQLGCVSGLMPEQDILVWAQGYAKDPFGPIVSQLPANLQWQITIPGLSKQAQ